MTAQFQKDLTDIPRQIGRLGIAIDGKSSLQPNTAMSVEEHCEPGEIAIADSCR
jgi:hypothetical protein